MISEGTLDKVRELPIESIVEPYVKLSRDGPCAQFKQKQRKVKMREMNCKWLRMSNIS